MADPAANLALPLRGQIDTLTTEAGVQPIRCRAADLDLLHPALRERTDQPAGVRLAGLTDSPTVEVELTVDAADGAWSIDLVVDDELVATRSQQTDQRTTVQFAVPGERMRRVEVYLPHFAQVTVHAARTADGSTVEPLPEDRPKWITYGSSITHCRAAHSPARTWPALVARTRGQDLTCLGFGGQCHFDPLIARTIAARPADLISLKLGINTQRQGTFNERAWAAAVLGFLLTVRDGHPETPLLIISPIHVAAAQDQPGPSGLTLGWMSHTLAELVEKLRARGDRRIAYLSGHALLGPEHAEDLQADGVHPTAAGYEHIAARFCQHAFR